MALESDITVVAFVRDYEKACEVLYDELIIEREDSKGPKLQVVVCDLVPPSYVAGYDPSKEVTKDDDDEEFAVSASRFYKDDLDAYDYRAKAKYDAVDLNPLLPLHDALLNATAVISTVGTVRSTLPFQDYLLKPWRVFISPKKWCTDKSHPYYVNYMVHKKVLEYCEEAQRLRNKEWRNWQNADNRRKSKTRRKNDDSNNEEKKNDRIRIIRITDACLANPAWDLVNVVTNVVRSLVFRYQAKCEKLLASSNIVDTIILRPGDLVDDIRNETITTMSVGIGGKLPPPINVGRDDVAALATFSALSDLNPPAKKKREAQTSEGEIISINQRKSRRNRSKNTDDNKPRHWNIAVGWSGDKNNGFKNAEACMQYIVKEYSKQRKSARRKKKVRDAYFMSRVIKQPIQRLFQKTKSKTIKPYKLFAFLPLFLFVYPTLLSLMIDIGKKIPVVKNAGITLFVASEPYRRQAFEFSKEKLLKLTVRRSIAQKTGLLVD